MAKKSKIAAERGASRWWRVTPSVVPTQAGLGQPHLSQDERDEAMAALRVAARRLPLACVGETRWTVARAGTCASPAPPGCFREMALRGIAGHREVSW